MLNFRLSFERAFRDRLLLGIPFVTLLVVSGILANRVYPTELLSKSRGDILTYLQNGTSWVGPFGESDAARLVETTAQLMQNLSFVGDESGQNLTSDWIVSLGPPLVFTVSRSEADCPLNSESLISDLVTLGRLVNASWLLNNVSNRSETRCFGSQYIACADANCGNIYDGRNGDLPVAIWGGSQSLNVSSSTGTIGTVGVLYSPWYDAYSIVRMYMDFDLNQKATADSYVTTFKYAGNDSVVKWLILVTCLLSGTQLLLDCLYMFKPDWFETDVRFLEPWILYKAPPILVSLASCMLFAFKYFNLSTEERWRALEQQIISLNGITTTQLVLNAYSEAARQETICMTIRTLDILLLFAFLFRFILYLSFHPRLAMLTETLRHGWDDFMHFSLVFSTFLLGFAFVFCMSFGDNFYLAATFPRSVFLQFMFLMGTWEVPETATVNDWLLVGGFYSLFGLVMYFTGLYFVLAFIRDAYGKYLEALRKVESVVGSPSGDLARMLIRPVASALKRWPFITNPGKSSEEDRSDHSHSRQTQSHAKHRKDIETAYIKWKSRIIHARKVTRQLCQCKRYLEDLKRTLHVDK